MIIAKHTERLLLMVMMICLCQATAGQVLVKGKIFDKDGRYGVPGVSVLSRSGAGTVTDSMGLYSIKLPATDSIYFSYLGKTTLRFAVNSLPANRPFDLSLPVSVETLPSVTVHQRSYKQDSIENRNEYRKVFDYDPDYLGNSSGGFGFGVSLSALLSAKKIRNMEALRKRLEWQEREAYIDHRFSKALVRRVTGIQSPALESFMKQYRPSYDLLHTFETDYEYYRFIKFASESFIPEWDRNHPSNPAIPPTPDTSGSASVPY